MIFHASIPADEPQRVAGVIAEIWGGEVLPFPPFPGAFVAMAGDARNSAVEVYPRSQIMLPGEGTGPGRPQVDPEPKLYGAVHLAVATDRTAEEIQAIGAREGWRVVRCSRGGVFDVLELWLENALLVEVLTPEMQTDYLTNATLDAARRHRAAAPGA